MMKIGLVGWLCLTLAFAGCGDETKSREKAPVAPGNGGGGEVPGPIQKLPFGLSNLDVEWIHHRLKGEWVDSPLTLREWQVLSAWKLYLLLQERRVEWNPTTEQNEFLRLYQLIFERDGRVRENLN